MNALSGFIVALLMFGLSGEALAADAAANWKAKCKSCHGDDGKAKTKVGEKEEIPDFTSPAWQKAKTDEAIKKVITDGSQRNKKMKPFKDKLSAEEIAAMVKHVRAFWKTRT
jgi:cytochrome c553